MSATLEEHLIEANTPEDFNDGQHWQIRSAEEADWAGRKLQQLYAKKNDVIQQGNRLIREAQAWMQAECAPIEQDISFFEGQLQAWLQREIEADDSTKPRQSRSLPCGVTVKRIAGRERVDVFDEDAFVQWALETEHSDLVRTITVPDKNGIKAFANIDGQFITEDGEILPGVTVVRGEDRYRVEMGSDD